MNTFKVLAIFSQAAAAKLDEHNPSVEPSVESYFEKDSILQKGYDWDIVEFKTKAEASAYIRGVHDSSGWTNPYSELL